MAVAVAAATAAAALAGGGAAVSVPRAPLPLERWSAERDNLAVVGGRVAVGGAPVAGVRLRVDGYSPPPTPRNGTFAYTADVTRLARHVVRVVDAAHATAGGRALSARARAALLRARAPIQVAYPLRDLHTTESGGGLVLSGRIGYGDGTAPPTVALLTYELTGTVVDSHGRPVVGARVSTRTADRDFWTVSRPTDDHGRYSSFFTASSELGGDPVPFTVRVEQGDRVWSFLPGEYVMFRRLRSASMDLRLPPPGYALALPLPTSHRGAIEEGVVVGAAVDGRPVRPLAATWPDGQGRFRLVLPRALAGRRVSLWEARLDLFSRREAAAGSAIDLRDWPRTLPRDAPRDLANITLPR